MLLLSEHLVESEVESGSPLMGRAGFLFGSLLERAGLDRNDFTIATAAWCAPPDNKLEGHPEEYRALAHCKRVHLLPLIHKCKPRVIVPMGNVALYTLMGVKGILEMRGYPEWDPILKAFILPTVHPSYIMRGNTNFGGVFIHDIQKAVEIARDGWYPASKDYSLDPTIEGAGYWHRDYLHELRDAQASGRVVRLAYDIETPIKGEDESETDADEENYQIDRIGFAYKANHALSVPWTEEYLPVIRELLGSDGEKVVWNAGFDNTRIASNGVAINGLIHDGMVAWHVLNSDLPKKLGFVAPFLVPDQPRWKHLSGSQPAYYNAIDADVELQAMARCEELLRDTKLWDPVYDLQVLKLDSVLHYMSKQGMPVDGEKRLTYAIKLDEKLKNVDQRIQAVVPEKARKLEVRKKPPTKLPEGAVLLQVPGEVKAKSCSVCGGWPVTKPHVTKKKIMPSGRHNPCLGASITVGIHRTTVPAILHPFNPSPKQLLTYMKVMHHKPIMTGKPGAKRVTTDEKALRQMMARENNDPLYPLVLERRELDKVAGTYIGRVEEAA